MVLVSGASPSMAMSNDNVDDLQEIAKTELLDNEIANTYGDPSEPKVAVMVSKVDNTGFPLSGAVLQILDTSGNILDEWVSNGTDHVSYLPEGEYILHEKSAPKGYIVSKDKKFTVSISIENVNAGVDHDNSDTVCSHYGGVPLYYIESNGVKEEVYCINQGLSEPSGIKYDGDILDEENIRMYMPTSDPTLTDEELYDKILNIIYNRNKASEQFPNLSEIEIRYITEYALKNYTSAMVDNGGLFRRYRYDPTSNTKFVEDLGNGNALGQLAKHWWHYHNRQAIPDSYAELYYYLINNYVVHPENMYLYVYSTPIKDSFDENFQNLLGVRAYDPYDDSLQIVNINEMEEPIEIPKTGEDEDLLIYTSVLFGSSIGILATSKDLNKDKKKVKKLKR